MGFTEEELELLADGLLARIDRGVSKEDEQPYRDLLFKIRGI